jgi:hypothetical protein
MSQISAETYLERIWQALTGVNVGMQANTNVAAVPLVARTSGIATVAQTNLNAVGAYVLIDITAIAGGETVTMFIDILQPDGTYTAIYQTAALNSIGLRKYLICPSAVDTGSQLTAVCQLPLPRTWRIRTLHAAGGSITYQIGVEYVGA